MKVIVRLLQLVQALELVQRVKLLALVLQQPMDNVVLDLHVMPMGNALLQLIHVILPILFVMERVQVELLTQVIVIFRQKLA
jgi:hypothetical protein